MVYYEGAAYREMVAPIFGLVESRVRRLMNPGSFCRVVQGCVELNVTFYSTPLE